MGLWGIIFLIIDLVRLQLLLQSVQSNSILKDIKRNIEVLIIMI